MAYEYLRVHDLQQFVRIERGQRRRTGNSQLFAPCKREAEEEVKGRHRRLHKGGGKRREDKLLSTRQGKCLKEVLLMSAVI